MQLGKFTFPATISRTSERYVKRIPKETCGDAINIHHNSIDTFRLCRLDRAAGCRIANGSRALITGSVSSACSTMPDCTFPPIRVVIIVALCGNRNSNFLMKSDSVDERKLRRRDILVAFGHMSSSFQTTDILSEWFSRKTTKTMGRVLRRQAEKPMGRRSGVEVTHSGESSALSGVARSAATSITRRRPFVQWCSGREH